MVCVSDVCLEVMFSFWFNTGQHGSTRTKWLSENIPVRFLFCNISWQCSWGVFLSYPSICLTVKNVKGVISKRICAGRWVGKWIFLWYRWGFRDGRQQKVNNTRRIDTVLHETHWVWLVSYFQAQEIDPEGLQAILVQVPRHRHLLLQEQRGERGRAHPADPPQR